MTEYDKPTRYLGQTSAHLEKYKRTAELYTWLLTNQESSGLFTKPFDRSKGHRSFFFPMFQVLNMLRVLNLESGARILEVGSGSGWVTEILVGLGYAVEAIDPNVDMISASKERIGKFQEKHKFFECTVRHHCSTIEEFDLSIIPFMDAVLFFESLHHVSDEKLCLKKCFYGLRPGGSVAIVGESNWQPGNAEQETFLNEEMARFGTLESPFTFEYLNFVLHNAGFTEVVRYHGVNGFFPVEAEETPIKSVADLSARFSNNVTAKRPDRG